jgi:hypothetical protein
MKNKLILRGAAISLIALAVTNSALAVQYQNEKSAVVNGKKESEAKGLNVEKFPVKEVTTQLYSKAGIRLGGGLIASWVQVLADAGYDTSYYKRGIAVCNSKLAGRRFILDFGNATEQYHVMDFSKPSPINGMAPTNIQNFAAGSQVDLTGLFCQVYGYEYLTQSIQINKGSSVAYAPLCEVMQGNSCGLADDRRIESIVQKAVMAHPCVPGMPICN